MADATRKELTEEVNCLTMQLSEVSDKAKLDHSESLKIIADLRQQLVLSEQETS